MMRRRRRGVAAVGNQREKEGEGEREEVRVTVRRAVTKTLTSVLELRVKKMKKTVPSRFVYGVSPLLTLLLSSAVSLCSLHQCRQSIRPSRHPWPGSSLRTQ